jgi:hypothetical protein
VAADTEDVLARGLGDEARDVEHDRLVVAGEHHLALGENRVHVLAADLRPHHVHVHVHAGEARHLGANAVFQPLVAQVGAPVPGGDRDPGGVHRAQAHRAVAHEGDRPQVRSVGEAVGLGPEQIEAGVAELIDGVRHLQQHHVGGVDEALHVLAQAKHRQPPVFLLVGPNALEDAQAIVQRVGHHVDVGVLPLDELAVHPHLVCFDDLIGRCAHLFSRGGLWHRTWR